MTPLADRALQSAFDTVKACKGTRMDLADETGLLYARLADIENGRRRPASEAEREKILCAAKLIARKSNCSAPGES